jgi:hypothetical protein
LNDGRELQVLELQEHSQPQICERVRDARHGESTILAAQRSAAARTSSIVGAGGEIASSRHSRLARARGPRVGELRPRERARHVIRQ